MTQAIIIKKLHKIFSPTNPELTARMIDDDKASCGVRGHCEALSIVQAAMNALGYRQWWNNVLVTLATTDVKQIDAPVQIPGSRSDKPVPLKNVAQRVLDYVLPQQVIGHDHSDSYCKNVTDRLDPAKKLFNVVDEKGQVKTIQHRAKIAGYFTEEQLMACFDENMVADTICLVRNRDHSINVHNDKQDWYVYDPNYDHASLKTINKLCKTKQEIVKELLTIQGNSISLEVATFDPQKKLSFPEYDKLIESDAVNLLREDGLLVLAVDAPEYLEKIILAAIKTPEGCNNIARGLCCARQTGTTGFQMIARNAPAVLPVVIACLKKYKESPDVLAKAIAIVTIDNVCGLHDLAQYARNVVPDVISCIKDSKEGPDALAKGVSVVDKRGWSGLHMLMHYAPKAVPAVILCLKDSKEGAAALIKAALAVDKTNKMTGVVMAKHHSLVADLNQGVSHVQNNPELLIEYIAVLQKESCAVEDCIVRSYQNNIRQINFARALQLAEAVDNSLLDANSKYYNLNIEVGAGKFFGSRGRSATWQMVMRELKLRLIEIAKQDQDAVPADLQMRALHLLQQPTCRWVINDENYADQFQWAMTRARVRPQVMAR